LMVMSLILLGVLVLLYKRPQHPESYLFLKLVGYLLIGGFTLSINALKLPIGFIVVLVFFLKPKWNREIKIQAALLGFLLYLTQLVYPVAENYLFERPREIPVTEMQSSAVDFTGLWKAIALNIHVTSGARMESFEVVLNKQGEIRMLSYDFVERVQDGFIYYDVDYDPEHKKATAKRHKIKGQWLQYDRSISTEYFFKRLNEFDLMQIKPIGDHPFHKLQLRENGTRISYAIKEAKKYRIDTDKIYEISNTQLPVKGYWISACGMSEGDEPHFNSPCEDNADYFFDAEVGG
jgi:hypothetical protein